MAKVPDDLRSRIILLTANGLKSRAVAKQLASEGIEINESTVRSIVDGLRKTVLETSHREKGDDATVELHVTKPIKTLNDAIVAAEVDQTVWYVDDWEQSNWTVPIKLGKDAGQEVIQTQQYRVKMRLKRLQRLSLQRASEGIFERMATHAPRYPKISRLAKTGSPCLAVMCLFDAHFGKLAWQPEVHENYDLKIAERVYANAVDDLIERSRHRNIEGHVFPIGNDFFHIDNSKNTTYAGTPQDTDGRYAKVIETGEMAVIQAIEKMLVRAPVHVVWVPGNHDPTTSYHLARTVWAWFRNCDEVTVDFASSPRKYHRYGKSLIGLTHGNAEKVQSLPNLMAVERPKDWAETRCREWLLGHEHRSRQYQTQCVDTFEGTTIRKLRSLTGTDAWHHSKGYVAGPTSHSAEVYWYDHDTGYDGHNIVLARYE